MNAPLLRRRGQGIGGYEGKGSPDRAMRWSMTELMLGERRAEPRILSF